MLLDDFYANGKNKTANNMQSASDIFIGLGKVIYNHKQDFVDLLQENGMVASMFMGNDDLINRYVEELSDNKQLALGTALLVNYHKKEVSFDSEEINDGKVKIDYSILNTFFSGGKFNNVVGVEAIATAVGEVAKLGTTVSTGRQSNKNQVYDMVKAKDLAKTQIRNQVEAEKQQALKDKEKSEKDGKKKTVIIVAAATGILVIGGIVFMILKNK